MNSTVYNRPGSLPALLRDLIKKTGASGMSSADLIASQPGAVRRSVQTALSRMVIDGSIFAVGARGTRRYFADSADAEKARNAPPPQSEPKRRVHAIWTKKEDDIVRKQYPDNGARAVAAMLKGRGYKSVSARAAKLGVQCKVDVRWATGITPARDNSSRRRKDLENLPIQPQPKRVEPTVSVKKARGPADQPGPATYHPDFKFTRCPSPPPVLRTGTHSQF